MTAQPAEKAVTLATLAHIYGVLEVFKAQDGGNLGYNFDGEIGLRFAW